jgi:glycosyltransferase involved in cell wall biosynthesis
LGEITTDKSNVLYISSFPPRECGIATFCKDLTNAMDKKFNPSLKSNILALNDPGGIYNYGKSVVMQLDEDDIEQYVDVAEKINKSEDIKLINIQHEFGIFGGEGGEFLIPFLEKLEKPIVITFHSVLPKPDKKRLKIVQGICKRCHAIIVMTESAVKILYEDYGVEKSKLHAVHHGVPYVEFLKDNSKLKELHNLKNRKVISTFGLINRGKGIEYVIKALPALVDKHPELLYLIIGETHPNVRKEEGESYRKELINLINELGLRRNVKFYNKYLTLQEIITYLKASDIYVYSALDTNQTSSGTLAYALGAGRAIIATPTFYARDMLKNKKGVIVELKSVESMQQALSGILSSKKLKESLERNAYKFSRRMLWENVARKHLEIFRNVVDVSETLGMYKLPRLKLNHLMTMSDDTGIIQHAKHSLPNRFTGYCLDDNARALIVACEYYSKIKNGEKILGLINTYLGFLHYAQTGEGYFQDFMNYEKKFEWKKSSEDSFGRVLWSLGYLLQSGIHENLRASAKFIFDKAVGNVGGLKSLRGWAFSLIGLCYYYKVYKNKDILEKIRMLADRIVSDYGSYSSDEWKWFEKKVTYSNGKLPEALFLAYEVSKDKKYLEVAEESLEFLSSLVILDNRLVLIGQKGWFIEGGKRAYYDQQPVDACSMVCAYVCAYRITEKKEYYEKAFLAFSWYLGNNSLNQTIYDEVSGGCYDGLLPRCVNLNQGSESTISYLLSRLELENFRKN